MKLLLTGASGFLGREIQKTLKGVDIVTLGRQNCRVQSDLAMEVPILPIVDVVVHAAGKAHFVPKSQLEEKMFFDVNVLGTRNLLEGLDRSQVLPKSFVFISSVSVYGVEKGTGIQESHPLNAQEAYGKSKIQAERLVQAWCNLNQVGCTILRLPLLAGPNPPGNLNSMISSIRNGFYCNISGGSARKSMVLASDVALVLLNASKVQGIFNLTDGCHPSFFELSKSISKKFGKPTPLSIPFGVAKVLSLVGDLLGNRAPLNSVRFQKMISDLTFDDSKARQHLNWRPQPVLNYFK